MFRFLSKLFAPTRRKPFTRRPRFRPTLEILEGRWAPAVLTVNSLADSTTANNFLTLGEALEVVNGTLGLAPTAGEQAQITGTLGNNDTIQFNLPSGPQTISLTGGALTTTRPVAIDGPGVSALDDQRQHDRPRSRCRQHLYAEPESGRVDQRLDDYGRKRRFGNEQLWRGCAQLRHADDQQCRVQRQRCRFQRRRWNLQRRLLDCEQQLFLRQHGWERGSRRRHSECHVSHRELDQLHLHQQHCHGRWFGRRHGQLRHRDGYRLHIYNQHGVF